LFVANNESGIEWLRVNTRPVYDNEYAKAVDYEDCPAAQQWNKLQQEVPQSTEHFRAHPEKALTAALTLTEAELMAAFTSIIAGSIWFTGHDDKALAVLSETVALDMASTWDAGERHFAKAVSRKVLADALTEIGDHDSAKAIQGMKKAEASDYASGKLKGTRWLPKPLRG